MENIEISLDKENVFEFDIDIRNDSGINKRPTVRFVVESEYDLLYSVEAEELQENVYKVVFPPLPVNEGRINCKLEVIVDDRYFIPWEGKGKFKKTLKVEATRRNKRTMKEKGVSVKAKIVEGKKVKRRVRAKLSKLI